MYQGVELSDEMASGFVGMVYQITCNPTGKKYIGKKLLRSTRRQRPKKGYVRGKRVLKEHDWRNYWGSSKALVADVDKFGMKCFTREVLVLCRSRGEASYYEASLQFENRVLHKPIEFYNDWIYCRVHRSHISKK